MRKLLYLIVAIVLLGLVLNPLAQALPQGEGVHQLPPGEAFGRESENIWVFLYIWSDPHPEIKTGTWVRFDFGFGSGSEAGCEEVLEGIEVEFYLNDKEVKDPLKYFTIKHMGTYWALTWIYRHPPFKKGEYSWIVVLGGSVSAITIDGAFTVHN